jgi:hypothetical protein
MIPHARRITNEEVVIPDEVASPTRTGSTRGVMTARTSPSATASTCLGALLARLETEIALNRLFDEYADLTVAPDIVRHESECYGPKRMPVLGVRSGVTALSCTYGHSGSVR